MTWNHHARRLGAAGLALILGVWVMTGAGCDRRAASPATESSYGLWDPAVAPRPSGDGGAERAGFALPEEALLSVAQSELAPYSVWRSRARVVRWFAGLPATGRGGPTFLAYSSPTGIATMKAEGRMDGAQMRENWILVGFPGAENWTDWDSPWAIFLQRRPESVALGAGGVEAVFPGETGHFAMMPLYGYYKPPQKDRGVLAGQGLKERELLTWEWPIVVARDPLTRLRYWAGATRWFPHDAVAEAEVAKGGVSVTERFRFQAWEFPDEWKTRPVKVAPVSPALGWAFQSEPSYAAEVKPRPYDFEIPTPSGPYYGVPDADAATVRWPVGDLVAVAEVPLSEAAGVLGGEEAQTFEKARARVRELMRERFGGTDGGAGGLSEQAGKSGLVWYARALPWCDDVVRPHAVAAMRQYLLERALGDAGLRDARMGLVKGGGDARWRRDLIEGLWAYVHFSGDRALLRTVWGREGVRALLGSVTRETGWSALGSPVDGGDQDEGGRVTTAVAAARLAYLAEDSEAWVGAMSRVSRELVVQHVRWRGARWIRNQQPWHSMDPLPKELGLAGPHGSRQGAGWTPMDLASSPVLAGFLESMADDVEGARLLRRQLSQDPAGRGSLLAWRRTLEAAPVDSGSRELLGTVRLAGWLLSPGATNRWGIPLGGEISAGSDAAVISACLGVARAVGGWRDERLIPTSFSTVRASRRVASMRGDGWGSGLTHQVVMDEGAARGDVRVTLIWPQWRGGGREGWTFGHVEVPDENPVNAGAAPGGGLRQWGATSVLTVRAAGR